MVNAKPSQPVGDPALVDGAVIRLVTDGDTDWVETWTPDGWKRGGAEVREYLMGAPTSPEILARLGVPRRDW